MTKPKNAQASDSTNTAVYPDGMKNKTRKARSGPMAAPMVSSIRCVPKDRARFCGDEAAVMSASRGAVRSPLPRRSTVTTALITANPLPTSSPMRATADREYPMNATHLG